MRPDKKNLELRHAKIDNFVVSRLGYAIGPLWVFAQSHA